LLWQCLTHQAHIPSFAVRDRAAITTIAKSLDHPLGSHWSKDDSGRMTAVGMDEKAMFERLRENRPSDAAVVQMLPRAVKELGLATNSVTLLPCSQRNGTHI